MRSSKPVIDNRGDFDAPKLVSAPPPEWADLETKRPLWKPDGGIAVQGYLLGMIELPQIGARPWYGYVVRLTRPTAVFVREGEEDVMQVAAEGTEVIVTLTTLLLKFLRYVGVGSTQVYEIYLQPGARKRVKNNPQFRYVDYAFRRIDLAHPIARTDDHLLSDTVSEQLADRLLTEGIPSEEELTAVANGAAERPHVEVPIA